MKVLSLGSLNIDHIYQVSHFAQPGETLSSQHYQKLPGGKGLNQSLAMKRAGLVVYHAGQISEEGLFLKHFLQKEGVNTDFVELVETPTGHAVIQVIPEGENNIVLYGGANQNLNEEFCRHVLSKFLAGDALVLQNEINHLEFILKEASRRGLRIILNPSPWHESLLKLPLNHVELFVLNEGEALKLCGLETFDLNLLRNRLFEKFPDSKFLLTRGAKGSVFLTRNKVLQQEALPVQVIDSTGAGDTFLGFFLSRYLKDESVEEALLLASKAASFCVQVNGAASSIPHLKDLS